MEKTLEATEARSTEGCYIRHMLDRIGDKWSLLILATLEEGSIRFSALKRSIGDISQRMLAQTLRSLECDGYISRKVYPSVPPAVEYSLTPFGRELLERLAPLFSWAGDHLQQVKDNRVAYESRTQDSN